MNPFTPKTYVLELLSRLETGKTSGLILHGKLPADPEILQKLVSLWQKGKPAYVEALSPSGKNPFRFPSGISPLQLRDKLSIFARYAGNAFTLHKILGMNMAGEIVRAPLELGLSQEVPLNDFYRGENTDRSFLMYQQNFSVMKHTLISEIKRLSEARLRGRRAELILEGLGNGHIFIGTAPRANSADSESANSLVALLAQAHSKGIQITILAQPKDAVPDASYEVAQRLQAEDIQAVLPPFKGREYLRQLH